MSNWQSQYDTMRRQFLVRAQERLAKTVELLDDLKGGSAEFEQVTMLHKDMHWLAGAGGTYKIVELTEIGMAGEEICERYLESRQPMPLSEMIHIRDLVQQARTCLFGATSS